MENTLEDLNNIKNVIFDVGDVLLDYRWREMLMDYGLDINEAQRIGRELFDDNLWHIYDIGTMSQEEIINAYCDKHPKDAKVIRWFITHGEYMHVPRPKVWEKVHELKIKGYKLYILSNYPEILFNKHTEYADFMDDMDGVMVSYMIKDSKPNMAIYDALCNRYGLKTDESIFFDDREENVLGAIKFGINAKKIDSQDSLLEYMDILLNKNN
ncbi:MAG: HAD family phosphatase [Lachnospiraceae bacterium]|nr:HAD family phosphatase [Lachnospiraceae bacterium]